MQSKREQIQLIVRECLQRLMSWRQNSIRFMALNVGYWMIITATLMKDRLNLEDFSESFDWLNRPRNLNPSKIFGLKIFLTKNDL